MPMTLFGTDTAEKELVFQVQIMLIEAQFFPLRAQEHSCKKKSRSQQIFSCCIFYITSKATLSLLNFQTWSGNGCFSTSGTVSSYQENLFAWCSETIWSGNEISSDKECEIPH